MDAPPAPRQSGKISPFPAQTPVPAARRGHPKPFPHPHLRHKPARGTPIAPTRRPIHETNRGFGSHTWRYAMFAKSQSKFVYGLVLPAVFAVASVAGAQEAPAEPSQEQCVA